MSNFACYSVLLNSFYLFVILITIIHQRNDTLIGRGLIHLYGLGLGYFTINHSLSLSVQATTSSIPQIPFFPSHTSDTNATVFTNFGHFIVFFQQKQHRREVRNKQLVKAVMHNIPRPYSLGVTTQQ